MEKLNKLKDLQEEQKKAQERVKELTTDISDVVSEVAVQIADDLELVYKPCEKDQNNKEQGCIKCKRCTNNFRGCAVIDEIVDDKEMSEFLSGKVKTLAKLEYLANLGEDDEPKEDGFIICNKHEEIPTSWPHISDRTKWDAFKRDCFDMREDSLEDVCKKVVPPDQVSEFKEWIFNQGVEEPIDAMHVLR